MKLRWSKTVSQCLPPHAGARAKQGSTGPVQWHASTVSTLSATTPSSFGHAPFMRAALGCLFRRAPATKRTHSENFTAGFSAHLGGGPCILKQTIVCKLAIAYAQQSTYSCDRIQSSIREPVQKVLWLANSRLKPSPWKELARSGHASQGKLCIACRCSVP